MSESSALNWLILFSTFATLGYILYSYFTRKHNFWKERGINGPKPLPYLGNQLDKFFYPMAEVDRQRYNQYGRIYGFYEGLRPILSIGDAELIKRITVEDWHVFINRRQVSFTDPIFTKNVSNLKDEKWKSVRSIMSPAFTSGKIRRMLPMIDECTKGVLDNLRRAAKTGCNVDMRQIFGAYTMDVIARCAFATQTDAHTNRDDPFVRHAVKFLTPSWKRSLISLLMPKLVLRLLNIDILDSKSTNFFKSVSQHLLSERKHSGQKCNDFLQLLIDAEMPRDGVVQEARDIVAGHFQSENSEDVERKAQLVSNTCCSETRLSDDEAVAQMFLFFIAGYETTANLLSFTAYALATNPEKQEKLYKELSAAKLGEEGMNYDTLNALDYLNAVVSETLRLYSPAQRLYRTASSDYVLSNSGVTIPKGTVVAIPIYAVHRDPENFAEPEKYIPERFTRENISKIKPYTYLPFGAGPRSCIGMRFALIEAKLLLCKILLQFKFVATEKTTVPVQYRKFATLLQPKDILLGIQMR